MRVRQLFGRGQSIDVVIFFVTGLGRYREGARQAVGVGVRVEQIRMTCRGGDPIDFFLYDHEFIKEPDSVKVAHTVAVISNLYDGDSHERVWSIQSTCFEKASLREALREEAIAITRQLRLDELID